MTPKYHDTTDPADARGRWGGRSLGVLQCGSRWANPFRLAGAQELLVSGPRWAYLDLEKRALALEYTGSRLVPQVLGESALGMDGQRRTGRSEGGRERRRGRQASGGEAPRPPAVREGEGRSSSVPTMVLKAPRAR